MRTWKILTEGDGFKPTSQIPLSCPGCGQEATLPYTPMDDNVVIAAFGLNLVFDKPWIKPPVTMMPEKIQCRNCRRIYDSKEKAKANA